MRGAAILACLLGFSALGTDVSAGSCPGAYGRAYMLRFIRDKCQDRGLSAVGADQLVADERVIAGNDRANPGNGCKASTETTAWNDVAWARNANITYVSRFPDRFTPAACQEFTESIVRTTPGAVMPGRD